MLYVNCTSIKLIKGGKCIFENKRQATYFQIAKIKAIMLEVVIYLKYSIQNDFFLYSHKQQRLIDLQAYFPAEITIAPPFICLNSCLESCLFIYKQRNVYSTSNVINQKPNLCKIINLIIQQNKVTHVKSLIINKNNCYL